MAEDIHLTIDQQESLTQLRDAIDMEQGHFSLIFAHCSYGFLRDRLIDELLQTPDLNLEVIDLQPETESLLDALTLTCDGTWKADGTQRMNGKTYSDDADGLIIRGFEQVEKLPELLTAINQVRESLKRNFPMPMVFWLTPKSLEAVMRFAPDLESWSVATTFKIDPIDLSHYLMSKHDGYFEGLQNGSFTYLPTKEATQLEVEIATAAQEHLADFDAVTTAYLYTLWGIACNRSYRSNTAIAHYRKALEIYQQLNNVFAAGRIYHQLVEAHYGAAFSDHEYVSYISPETMERLIAAQKEPDSLWWRGYEYMQKAIATWKSCGAEGAIAWALPSWQSILSYLELWTELESYGRQAIQILEGEGRSHHRESYWLAKALEAQGQNQKAKELLERVIAEVPDGGFVFPLSRQLLAQIYEKEERLEPALQLLEEAESSSDIQRLSRAHIRILEQQRQILFVLGRYLDAYKVRERKQLAEYEYSFKAFIGATRIQKRLNEDGMSTAIRASGRGKDVEKLVDWITGKEHAVTVVYGHSGVGKSSLVNAGLIPELAKSQRSAPHGFVQLTLRSYADWQESLLNDLRSKVPLSKGDLGGSNPQDSQQTNSESIEPMDDPPQPPFGRGENLRQEIFELLRECDKKSQLVVLIFDQFEEFFFTYEQEAERQQFFELLGQVINETSYVNLVFSLRRDYMHFLLGRDQLKRGNQIIDLLSREHGYELRNFSRDEAIHVFQGLTARTSFQPEQNLIEAVVDDLIDPATGRVRPIELQIIGRQLEETAGGITTLDKYQKQAVQQGVKAKQSPKAVLVRSYLRDVVDDCGTSENERLAYQVMFLLTDKQGRRPIKSFEELEVGIKQLGQGTENVGMILEILVLSDLVSVAQERDGETTKYQLVHDYIVSYVREIEEQDFQQLFQAERKKRIDAEKELSEILQLKIKDQEKQISRIRRQWGQSVTTIVALLVVVASMVFLARRAESQRYQQWQVTQNAELMALSNASEALFYSDQQFDALLESLRATVRLRQLLKDDAQAIALATKLKVLSTLEQSYFGLQEKNRFEGHSDSIFDVNLSPDGQLLVSASWDRTVRLWSLEGELLTMMIGHEERVTRVVFAPDGKSLFSSSWDNTVKEWSLTGKELRSIEVDLDSLTAINLSPDGELLAIASGTGAEIRALDGSTIQKLTTNREVYWIAFSPDGEEILTLEEGNKLILWNRLGDRLQTITLPIQTALLFAAYSPDGKTLIGGDAQGNLTVWERGDRRDRFPVDGLSILGAHKEPILFINFNSDGSQFATASADDTVKVWDQDFTLQKTFFGHRDDIRSVIFHPRTEQLISGSMDKTIRLWEYETDNRVVLRHGKPIQDLAFSPDGASIATASNDKTIRLWQRQDGKLKHTLMGHTDWVNAVAWHPDGMTLISGGDDDTVRIWSVDGTLIKTLRDHDDRVLDVAWSPQGDVFASTGLDQTVRIWSREGELLQTLAEHQDRVNSIDFSPDGKLLASASDDRTVKVWQRRLDNSFFLVLQMEEQDNWITDVVFSRDNQYLAFSSYDNSIQLLRMSYKNNNPEFEPPIVLKGHSDSVAHLQFNPLFPILATSTWNNQLHFWQLDNTLLKTLEGHKELITGLDWSPDGQAIATSSNDNTTIIWELDLEFLLAKSCDRLSDYLAYNPKVRDSDRQLCETIETESSSK